MTDDLVKRLRDWEHVWPDDMNKPAGNVFGRAADRIEELEADLAEYKHVASAIDTQWAPSQDEIADLKAELVKAKEAIECAELYIEHIAPTQRRTDRRQG